MSKTVGNTNKYSCVLVYVIGFFLSSFTKKFPRCICEKHIWIKDFKSKLDGFIFVCHSTYISFSKYNFDYFAYSTQHITISISLANLLEKF